MRILSTRSRRRLKAVPSLVAMAGLLFAIPAARAADSSALLTWTKLAPATSPPPRVDAAMAFDASTNSTVLFGGQSANQFLGDTWMFDGTTWTKETPATSPPPLASASMAYDNMSHTVLLFGGQGSAGVSNQTWSWDGTTWTQVAAPPAGAPPARYGASMASDTVTGTVVLFGGASATGTPLGDTWSWNGTAWTASTPSVSPVARSGAAMTFDSIRGLVVLFGGTTSGPQADTWTFDGTNWTQQAPSTSPPARSAAAFGFDLGSNNGVLFGGLGGSAGTTALGDTWLWNGTNWVTSLPLSVLPSLNPPARSGASMATQPSSGRLILFGGTNGTTSLPLGDTWGVSTVQTIPPSTTTTIASGSTSTSGSTTSTSRPATSELPTSSTSVARPVPATPNPAALAVNTNTVRRGDDVRVSGSGFAPDSLVTITLHSVSTVVGTTDADAQGRFTLNVVVPTNIPTGPHRLEATGPAMRGGQAMLMAATPLSVTAPGGGNHWLLPILMVVFTLLLAGGAGVVLVASTRWHRHSTP